MHLLLLIHVQTIVYSVLQKMAFKIYTDFPRYKNILTFENVRNYQASALCVFLVSWNELYIFIF